MTGCPKGRFIKNVGTEVDHIRQVISQAHPANEWLVLDEFPLEGGKRKTGTPRIDVLAIKTVGSGHCKPLIRVAYEIKVSRQDFLEELRNPKKRRKAYNVCDKYWFAVPEELVQKNEVPPECGLIWAVPGLGCPVQIKSARNLKPRRPSTFFMMDLARRAYQVGRRDGAATCAFERFDMLMDLAYMLIKNEATAKQRKAAVLTLSRAMAQMQRHPEARALARIASGGEPTAIWFVQRTLQSARYGTGGLREESH